MKIGLLTLPLHTNIGGILQAYALQNVLERYGHSVAMLTEKQPILKSVKKRIKKILCFIKKEKKNKEQIDSEKFIKTHFRSWRRFENQSSKLVKDFDAVIVGSDQVWRTWGKRWNVYHYFFDFIQDPRIKKYAYAASFGFDKWMFSDVVTEEMKKLVKSFAKISVRENDAVLLCKKYLGIDAEWLLDPTMLLDKQDYANLAQCGFGDDIGLVCYYIDDDEKFDPVLQEVLESAARFFDNKWVLAKSSECVDKGVVRPTIEKWLYNMMNASFVVTNSFHGVVFSIIFEKNFIVLDNKSGGTSRINSILSMFGLENRLVKGPNEVEKNVNEKIDWRHVLKMKVEYQNRSLEFIRNL